MPSHYLNQWWNTVYLTLRYKLQWNVNWNSHIFSQENNMLSAKWQPFCLSHNVFIHWSLVMHMQHVSVKYIISVSGGRFKNTHELLNLRALKFSPVNKNTSFNVWVRYFVWNFKGTLWNSTQNTLPIHWKMQFLYNIAILRALRFKSSLAFLKYPPGTLSLCLTMSPVDMQFIRYIIAFNLGDFSL